MYVGETMPKDLSFKLRLDAQDRERLEAIAAHLAAPAATAIRILIKEKYDAILAAQRPDHVSEDTIAELKRYIARSEAPLTSAEMEVLRRMAAASPAKPARPKARGKR